MVGAGVTDVGACVLVGAAVGRAVGGIVGILDGTGVGFGVGTAVGPLDGFSMGLFVGVSVMGGRVGALDWLRAVGVGVGAVGAVGAGFGDRPEGGGEVPL